jgi:hypothetical protein
MQYGASDVIAFKDLDTGGNSAGNGGDGYNFGNLTNHQTATFKPYNKAVGADAHAKAGDEVFQKAHWEEGDTYLKKVPVKFGAPAVASDASSSPGSQTSESGHNDAKVVADTTAYQTNFAKIHQSSNQIAGNGGDGGSHNIAKGGDVSFALVHSDPTTEYKHFDIKDSFNVESFALDDLL